ncbi:MAG: aminotransferase class I/II-fold pyridoxal phosphate-dependent enzyme [Bowdeniella nasicola]|nr:aminotransferase class I/II-fold pyridoxal phosphate-dependent enzyme [Bowdeniella nasicola]
MPNTRFFADFSPYSRDAMARKNTAKWGAFPGMIGAWIAEMDFGIPPAVAAVLRQCAADGTCGYLLEASAEQTREACASWLAATHNWQIASERIRLFPDVLTALEAAIVHGTEPGQPVVVPTPSYPPFLVKPQLLGRELIQVPSLVDDHGYYRLDIAAIREALAPRGGLLVLCNPWNPVGRVLTKAELLDVAAVVDQTKAMVFADEIHAPVIFDGTHLVYADLDERTSAHTITATSNSKGWNIPGLKCAQVIFPPALEADLGDWFAHYQHLASPIGVAAAAACYREADAWLADVLTVLRHNRDLFAELLADQLPRAIHHPAEGTYLAWVDFRPYEIAHPGAFFRTHAGVALNDGCDAGASGFGRVNLAMSPDNIVEALTRIARAVDTHAAS